MNHIPYLRLHFGIQNSGRAIGAKQIADTVAEDIERGLLPAGGRMPPIRVLAHQLGLSKNTVHVAYDELRSRGLIEAKGRRGVFIRETSRAYPSGNLEHRPALPDLKRGYVEGSDSLGTGSLNLCNVFIDPDLLPREKLTACFRSVLQSPGLPHFYDPQGYPPLRAAIAARLTRRGMETHADEIVITTGSQQALDIACRALRHKRIATESPAYAIGKALFEMNGMAVTGLPLNPFSGIPLQDWKAAIAAQKPSLLYLTTNFQNPTGYSYATHELTAIAGMSAALGFGIIEDDWGSDMLSFSEYRPPLRALCGPTVLYMNSFTKKLLPGLRIGYLAAHAELIPALVDAKRVATLGNPSLMELTLFEFLDRGYYDTHLRQMQAELDRRYRKCLELLAREMPGDVRWTKPGGGPLIWLELPSFIDLEKLKERMSRRDVAINVSTRRFFGDPHLHGLPLGFAYLKTEVLARGLRILGEELRHLQ